MPVHQLHIAKILAHPRDHVVVGAGPASCAVNIHHHNSLAVGQLLQQSPKLLFCQIAVGAQVDDRCIAQLRFFTQALHHFQTIAALPAHLGFHRSRRQTPQQVRAGTQQNRVTHQSDFLVTRTVDLGWCHWRGAGACGLGGLWQFRGLEGLRGRHEAQDPGVDQHQTRNSEHHAASPGLALEAMGPAGFDPAVRGFSAQQGDGQAGGVDPGQLQGVSL